MAWYWPTVRDVLPFATVIEVVRDVLPVATVTEVVSLTLLLSTIEYAIIGIVIGKAVHGKKLRQFSVARGWEWRKGDPEGSLRAAVPSVLGNVRPWRIKHTVRGETPQGPFTLWVHKNPLRWRRGRSTVLVETRMPVTSPGIVIAARDEHASESSRYPAGNAWFLEQALSPALSSLVRAHPDATWDWTGDRLVVSSTKVKGMDALQDLVCAADMFRALVPEATPSRPAPARGTTGVIAVTA